MRRCCLNTPLSGHRLRLNCTVPAELPANDVPTSQLNSSCIRATNGWRRPGRLTPKIAKRMSGLPSREPLLAAENFVLDPDSQQRLLTDGSENRQRIVVKRRPQIFRCDFQHRDPVAVGLQLTVGEALFAQQLRSGDLEPRQIIGVVDDAHHVGLRVTDGDAGAGLDHRRVGHGFEQRLGRFDPAVSRRPLAPGCAEPVAKFFVEYELFERGGELRRPVAEARAIP